MASFTVITASCVGVILTAALDFLLLRKKQRTATIHRLLAVCPRQYHAMVGPHTLGFQHLTIIHKYAFKKMFVNEETGELIEIHTNCIEGAWKHAKDIITIPFNFQICAREKRIFSFRLVRFKMISRITSFWFDIGVFYYFFYFFRYVYPFFLHWWFKYMYIWQNTDNVVKLMLW